MIILLVHSPTSTQEEKTLKSWIWNMGIERGDYTLLTASKRVRRPSTSEVVALRLRLQALDRSCGPLQIVALGSEAFWASKRAGFKPLCTLPLPGSLIGREDLLNQLMSCKSLLRGKVSGEAA